MKLKLIILLIGIFITLSLIGISSSLPPSFTIPRNCSVAWGFSCDGGGDGSNDDAWLNGTLDGDCDGAEYDAGISEFHYVREVYVNASSFFMGNQVNATCRFYGGQYAGTWDDNQYMFYYNGTGWMTLNSWTKGGALSEVNRSVVFIPNNTEGTHYIRCTVCNRYSVTDYCADLTGEVNGCMGLRDNDDVNFTVTDKLKYTSWNLYNYTSGTTIPDGANLTRNDKINASAHWNKDLDTVLIQHNGTGFFDNYTIQSPYPDNWTNYTLVLSNTIQFNETGLIEVSYIWANDTYGLDNTTSPSHYFYLWGNSKVDQIYLNKTSIYNNTAAKIFCRVIDSDLNYSIPGYNVSFYMDSTYLNSSLTNSSGWANLSYTFTVPNFPGYLDLSCNITDSPNLYYNATSENSNTTVLEVVDPGQVLMGNFWFEYLNVETNKTNLNTSLVIKANVSDTLQMQSVKVNLTYPNNTINVNLSMTGDTSADWHVWNYNFSNISYPLNMTGNYTVGIIAKNSNDVQNMSTYYMTFYVNDTLTLNLTSNYTLFMRGENVTIQALDVNDRTVDNVNWTVNVTKINETYYNTSKTTTYTYTILNDDPEGNYSIFVINATKYGNYGNRTWYFNVSKNFTIEVSVTPATSKHANLLIDADLYNVRGSLHTLPVNANITCQNQTDDYLTYPLTFNATGHADFDNTCWTPNAYSAKYYIKINVSDQYNNSGFYNNTFTTESSGTKPPSDGDGSRSVPSPGPTCTPEAEYETDCTDGKDNDCDGATDCADADCFDVPVCIKKIPNFNFTLTPPEIQIVQGEDGTITGSMSNTGNIRLLLITTVDIEEDCCSVDIPSSFSIPEQTTEGFNLTIHINTSIPPGDYVIKVKISYQNLQNSQSIRVTVRPNEIITHILETTPPEITRLLSEIKEIEDAGLDLGYLGDRISKMQTTIENAKTAVQEDDLELLKQYKEEIESDIEFIKAEKERLALVIYVYINKWTITYGITIGIILTYMITRILYPFVRLSHEIVKLSFDVKTLRGSVKQAQNQYFSRKIDEDTFRRITSDKHGQVLKLTSQIKLKREQRIDLIKKRLNPLSLGEYVRKKTSKKKESK